MSKKILISLSVIGVIAAIAIGATTAYFSNTETSSGNTFIAGAIDLKVDSKCTYNGEPVSSCNFEPSDLDGTAIFNLNDVKPGDEGEDTISLHVDTNPAWICAEISNITNMENGCNPPEAKVDTTCDNPGEDDGELWDNLYFNIWMDDDCDNVPEEGELPYLVENAKATDIKWPIADSTTGGQPIQNACIGVAWYVPGTVENEIQSDSVSGDVTFKAYQARNNTPFYCYPVCGNGSIEGNEQCDDGSQNGTPCDPPYGESCNYCSTECKIVILYGGYCGNGILENGEQCDDGNTQNGDGCSAACQKECFAQADVMLVLDKSSSIDSGEMASLKAAAHAFVNAMNPDGGVHMGQTSFADMSGNGNLDLQLTGDMAAIHAAIDALPSGGYTNLADGINLANAELASVRDRITTPDYMVVITDGQPNRPGCSGVDPCAVALNAGATAADAARAADVEIFVVGVGSDVNSTYLINEIADDPAHYFYVGNYDELEDILEAIANCQQPPQITGSLTVTKTVVNDNGGTKGVGDFPLFVSGYLVTSGVAVNFPAGSYTVSETQQSGYTASAWGGSCAANGSITIAAGQPYNCTITNDDVAQTTVHLNPNSGSDSTPQGSTYTLTSGDLAKLTTSDDNRYQTNSNWEQESYMTQEALDFRFADIPTGATVNSVSLSFEWQRNSNDIDAARIQISGNNGSSWLATLDLSLPAANTDDTVILNLKALGVDTVSEVNNLVVRFQAHNGTGTLVTRHDWVQVDVTYTP
jgi:predicted ribosomally synthesized peptide with SipW-like signal peptide